MSSKRITINKILSSEDLVKENHYFQVRPGRGQAHIPIVENAQPLGLLPRAHGPECAST